MMSDKIKHVFVVMFENRSFDHMLGFSAIEGIDLNTGMATRINGINNPDDYKIEFPIGSGNFVKPTPDAPFSMKFDPPHEFKDTAEQLCGKRAVYKDGSYPPINNLGFAESYFKSDKNHPGENMKCFASKDLPVLNRLANEFAICDNWFSSIPGPTWPNRFFLHAATSGGLDDSPSKTVIKHADLREEFSFQNGHIFEKLNAKGIPWVIYEGDELTQAFALKGMHMNDDKGYLHPFKNFKKDLSDSKFSPAYIFIEPCYGFVLTDKGSFKCGNSQHPLDDVRRGEGLLKYIYETIRNSPHWESSCLIVTYDEHGGFYDHVAPPRAVPPGDAIVDPSYNQNGFAFDQLGVRVPTLVISPWIPKSTIDHNQYDHTSILRTLEELLNLDHLTNRDKNARSLESLFKLNSPRQDVPTALDPTNPFINLECNKCLNKIKNLFLNFTLDKLKEIEITPTARGFLHLAFLKKIHTVPASEKAQEVAKYNSIDNKGDALKYIQTAKEEIKKSNELKQPQKDALFAERNQQMDQYAGMT
jgi:phospholipase C